MTNHGKTTNMQAVNSVWAKIIIKINYKQERQVEYPEISEQLDFIYHDLVNGTTKWKDKITAIKNKYPKEKIFINERIRDLKYDLKNKIILLALEENGEIGILSAN